MAPGTDRRHFLRLAAGSAMAGAMSARIGAGEAGPGRFRALAFDAFPVFDPRPVASLAESLFPGQGAALMDAWRTRLFEYQWLRALGSQYTDFLGAARDALAFATTQLQLDLPEQKQRELMDAWSNLKVWPDAAGALHQLHEAGLRLAFLSNMTEPMLAGGLRNAGLDGLFEAVISTDRIRSYKPDPRAYQLGVDVLELPREQILFVAFAGWDVAGAKWFGYPVFWVNRQASPEEQLGATADAAGPDLAALTRFALSRPRAAG